MMALTAFSVCKLQQSLDVSNCPNVSHDGLSSLINGAVCLRQLILVSCSPVRL